ncbi:MAG TPA: hypothetical protein DCQ92_07355 [Verrucomicrobia subdivision 3 bacterium]|nr:hypothetical protein [Limisphaerales bacterium]
MSAKYLKLVFYQGSLILKRQSGDLNYANYAKFVQSRVAAEVTRLCSISDFKFQHFNFQHFLDP